MKRKQGSENHLQQPWENKRERTPNKKKMPNKKWRFSSILGAKKN